MVDGGRKRINVDLSPEARAGWEAMGDLTGGNYTAIAEILGIHMGRAAKSGLKDKTWQAIVADIRRRSHRRGR
jgi:hypothetical protein